MSEANKTEEQHHTWTDEQIHILLSTVADLHARVSALENGSKQSVSILSFLLTFPFLKVVFRPEKENFVIILKFTHLTFYPPCALRLKDNDAANPLPHQTAELVNEAEATKATPGNVQGKV